MKISINWIKEFVDLSGIDEKLLTERFNLATAEIEDVEYKGKETYGVVFGKILSVENVEGSDHLHKLLVDVGSEKLQIVCGAPNVRVGMITCVAKVGGGDIHTFVRGESARQAFGCEYSCVMLQAADCAVAGALLLAATDKGRRSRKAGDHVDAGYGVRGVGGHPADVQRADLLPRWASGLSRRSHILFPDDS